MVLNKNFRASTLIPIYTKAGITNKVNFLSYWKLKNNYSNVEMKLSFRDAKGQKFKEKHITIDPQPKVYELKLEELMEKSILKIKDGFNSYVEIEVFFEKEPLIKYPAIIYSLENANYSNSVHSCLRTFNPSEKIPTYFKDLNQTGFDSFFKKNIKNYILFIGGEKQEKYNFNISLVNKNNITVFSKEITLKNNRAKKLFNIILEEEFNLDEYEGEILKVIIGHDIEDIFPRFYVGNYSTDSLPSITHTFFDESSLPTIKKNNKKNNLASAFIFPLLKEYNLISSISSYKSNQIWKGQIIIKILNDEGNTLVEKYFDQSQFNLFNNISKNYTDKCINISEYSNLENLFCKYEFISENFPKRFKLGLNIGPKYDSNKSTNICFSPQINEKDLLKKQFNTAWAPIGGSSNFNVFFHNTSFNLKSICDHLEVIIFSNTGDNKTLNLNLKADQSIVFNSSNKDINKIIGKELGYIYMRTSNPFFSCWYLSIDKNGVGGDHSF